MVKQKKTFKCDCMIYEDISCNMKIPRLPWGFLYSDTHHIFTITFLIFKGVIEKQLKDLEHYFFPRVAHMDTAARRSQTMELFLFLLWFPRCFSCPIYTIPLGAHVSIALSLLTDTIHKLQKIDPGAVHSTDGSFIQAHQKSVQPNFNF